MAVQRDPREIYRTMDSEPMDDSLSEEQIERFNLQQFLQKRSSRKNLFTGKLQQPLDPQKKYG